jgi:hypothetical protein
LRERHFLGNELDPALRVAVQDESLTCKPRSSVCPLTRSVSYMMAFARSVIRASAA